MFVTDNNIFNRDETDMDMKKILFDGFGLVKGLFILAANLLQPATVAFCCRKNRKISNYLQQPSPLGQLLRPCVKAENNNLYIKFEV